VIRCPNCRGDTTTRSLPAHGAARPIVVEACAACHLLWFDRAGSVRLTPESVIDLFEYIGTTAGAARTPLASTLACPRCSRPLVFTHDLQRTTRFNYWRCVRDRGKLISFAQFLREKNFIRTPSPEELARLRRTVRQVTCSQCGAPVDLARDSACRHCATPVALVDPDGVAKALRDLATAHRHHAPGDSDAVRAVLAEAHAEAVLERARMHEIATDRDLVTLGVAAIGAWLASRLIDR
jgi:hypothetical protein